MDARVGTAAAAFLRGDLSVPGLTFAFREAVDGIAAVRPLRGREVALFDLLEEWEASGWPARPGVVDRLRWLAAEIADAACTQDQPLSRPVGSGLEGPGCGTGVESRSRRRS